MSVRRSFSKIRREPFPGLKMRWPILALLASSALAFAQANPPTIEQSSVSADAALKIAQTAMQAARDMKITVAVAVVDNAGRLLVLLRADHATEQFVEGAIQKAWTAVNLRRPTLELAEKVAQGGEAAQLAHIPKALILPGGVPLVSGETIVGAIGVAGSRVGAEDDAAARAGAADFAKALQK